MDSLNESLKVVQSGSWLHIQEVYKIKTRHKKHHPFFNTFRLFGDELDKHLNNLKRENNGEKTVPIFFRAAKNYP